MRWHLKSLASRLFAQVLIQVQLKENVKAPHHWPLWGTLSPVNSPHKGPVMWKMFPFHDVILSVHIRDVVHHYGWQQYSEVMAGPWFWFHNSDVIMSVTASQIIDMSLLGSTICSGMDQRKHKRSASLAFVRGIHQWLVDSPHKGPITWKMSWWCHHAISAYDGMSTVHVFYCLFITTVIQWMTA